MPRTIGRSSAKVTVLLRIVMKPRIKKSVMLAYVERKQPYFAQRVIFLSHPTHNMMMSSRRSLALPSPGARGMPIHGG